MKIRQNPTSHSARITLTDNPLKVSNLFFFSFSITLDNYRNAVQQSGSGGDKRKNDNKQWPIRYPVQLLRDFDN
jgi:hypothetical protein